ncbi:MAG: glycine dehydrogenase (aminomethyl-transferring), partial [Saprospiraceae bacterium]|nr:glycine dehydrogenase (aminomethyl-transferring) [Saprospiraceae bacterium]
MIKNTGFEYRHIGVSNSDVEKMLSKVDANSIDDLIEQTVPASILDRTPLNISKALTEVELLVHLAELANKNQVLKSVIGLGYHDTHVPTVIQRNIFENPGWYTQYTPYQAEISQGRLEALLNFQTMVCDLTGLPIANASLLDEA